jgi:hypothetical protein
MAIYGQFNRAIAKILRKSDPKKWGSLQKSAREVR